ncbi:hypothetical protein ACGFS9_14525 [Streptomyces sp. NPDC048566]|uniref:hypothetical protein n=1 Tax=Streptomyces sp. NPDC048566 TaxID=3365569 RepID=UPI003714C636
MRRPRRRAVSRASEPTLMAHVRSVVWGPAEFVGLPPWWLVGEGLLAGLLGVAAIIGAGAVGAWSGLPPLADGEGGLVAAGALALYLALVRAGRALIGIVALLGMCLALHAPQAAAGVVLADRGRLRSVVVTDVDHGAYAGRDRRLCSVADEDGVPLTVRIWRGCDRATRPGDALPVVYDPKGRVPPRGVAEGSVAEPLIGVGALAAALVTGCVVAVVRSYRLTHVVPAPPGGRGPADPPQDGGAESG